MNHFSFFSEVKSSFCLPSASQLIVILKYFYVSMSYDAELKWLISGTYL